MWQRCFLLHDETVQGHKMKQITRTEWAWLFLRPFSILGAVLVALQWLWDCRS